VSALDELLGPPATKPEGWPPQLRDHLSASSIRMLATCPEQFRRVYLKGERQRPGAALVWGSADHYAHEQNFSQKIESHTDISSDDVKLAFAEGFDRKVADEGGEDEVDWGDDKVGELKDRGVKLAAAYHEQVSPRVQPTAVEKSVSLDLPGLIVPVIGRTDVETAGYVIEGKTSSSRKSKPEPQWRLQGTLYQLATGLPIEWHVKAKTKTPAVYTPKEEPGLRLVASQRLIDTTVERARRLVATMLAFHEVYGPDEPWPTGAPDYGWACDYCGFRPDCVWWKDDAVQVLPPVDEEPEYVKLERLLLDHARARGNPAEVEAQIHVSYVFDDIDTHVAWLKEQILAAEQV
jgi:hypothetical protein